MRRVVLLCVGMFWVLALGAEELGGEESLASRMARLGQLRDNLDRFWGEKREQGYLLEMVDEMIEQQRACIGLVPVSIEMAPAESRKVLLKSYRGYSKRSVVLLKKLRKALAAWDLDRAKAHLRTLDQNRRDAHEDFG